MIVNQGGIPLFTQSYERGVDCCSTEHHSMQKIDSKTHLFSGFITAISGMANEFDADLKQLNMGSLDVFLESKYGLKTVLVVKTDSDHEKQVRYREATEVIMDRFHSEFSNYLEEFDGNIDRFKTFGQSLRDIDILEDGTISTPICRSCIVELTKKFER